MLPMTGFEPRTCIGTEPQPLLQTLPTVHRPCFAKLWSFATTFLFRDRRGDDNSSIKLTFCDICTTIVLIQNSEICCLHNTFPQGLCTNIFRVSWCWLTKKEYLSSQPVLYVDWTWICNPHVRTYNATLLMEQPNTRTAFVNHYSK